jgi:NTP pyrophosphatase (non-canonical NTP hydrolase)
MTKETKFMAGDEFITHDELIRATAKPGQGIIDGLTPQKADYLHMAVGVAGEAGELLDAIKKHAIYGKDLDRENVIEELGDIEFYVGRIRQLVGVSRDEVLRFNVAKLATRYAGLKYSDKAAQERADKKGE